MEKTNIDLNHFCLLIHSKSSYHLSGTARADCMAFHPSMHLIMPAKDGAQCLAECLALSSPNQKLPFSNWVNLLKRRKLYELTQIR